MDIEEAKENVKKLLKNANPFTMQPYIYFSIETVLNELEKKDRIINLMALAILNYDDQLVINRYKDIDAVKETFEEYLSEVEREGK